MLVNFVKKNNNVNKSYEKELYNCDHIRFDDYSLKLHAYNI